MQKPQRPTLGNILAILNLLTTAYFAVLLAIAVMYRRIGANLNINNDFLYSFLAFGMEPPLLLTALVFCIAVTCLVFVFKSGAAGTTGVGLSLIPDLIMTVFCGLTIAGALPWQYTQQPASVIVPLITFAVLFSIKLFLMIKLVGTDYYPKAQQQ